MDNDMDNDFEKVLIQSANEILNSCIEILKHVELDSEERTFAIEMGMRCKKYLKTKKE